VRNFKLGSAVRQVLWISGLALASSSASIRAQEADSSKQDDSNLENIVVTGSRIARVNFESTVPIVSMTSEDVLNAGNASLGDMLNDLPSLRSTYSQANSSRFLGTAGLNLLDLRGLDPVRTLVLVNGRRHVGSDILSSGVSVDINTIPLDLIDRVDIVTGGNSAVYGSDAIAGVVNFILKKDFEGLEARLHYGESTYHDAELMKASTVWGTNFADRRGNIAASFEFSKQKPFFASNRPNLSRVGGFVTVDSDGALAVNGSDGNPDRTYFNDIRTTTIAIGGLLQFSPAQTPVALAPCGRDATGAAFRCNYIFQPDGSLVPQSGVRIGLAPNGSFYGGNGTTGRERETVGIFPKLDRYSLNVFGHLTITEALEPFFEAKYVQTDSMRYATPAFYQGSTIDGFFERPRFDNPFLTDGARATIQSARAAAGLAPATNGTRLVLFKNLTDLGGRREDAQRETTRIVAGLRGDVFDGWKYEASVNYGRFRESTKVLGNLDMQRFTLAMDSTRDTGGNIVCNSKLDPSSASIYLDPADPYADYATARLAGDIASCVPLNPFGEGNITPAMRDYLVQNTTSIGKIDQLGVQAFMTGSTENWFSLPAGAIDIAAGVEYRSDKNFFEAEDLVESGITFYNALPLFDPPSFAVKEVFAELRIPLLKQIVAVEELTLSVAGRTSDYDGATGRVTAYNAGIEWSPITDLRLRAGIAHAIRAPNLVDLYSDQSQNFAPNFVDPCSDRNVATGAATRAANCNAAGKPAGYDYVHTASLETLSGGNPKLKQESSDSITLGAAYQPHWLPGFALTVDYYDIDLDDVITSASPQQIANACYDSSSLNNQFCGLFQRAGAGGGPKGEIPFQILEGSLQELTLNYAKQTVRGVDIETSYKTHIGSLGQLTTRLIYTHMIERNEFLNPGDPTRANRLLGELGDPADAFNLDFEFKRDQLALSWQIRHIGKMVLNAYEDTYSVQGRAPENEDYADMRYYPTTWYHDVRASYEVMTNYNVYVGVDNVANQLPPLGLTTAASTSDGGGGIYEPRGRFFYAGLTASFIHQE
jgi:outer membrane receptor protein involved in Fe transport